MKKYRLILYNAENLDVDEAQEMASRIRRVTYAPLIMLTIDEAAAATQDAGADLCVPANMELHRLFSTVMGQIRRNECFSQYDDFRPGTKSTSSLSSRSRALRETRWTASIISASSNRWGLP